MLERIYIALWGIYFTVAAIFYIGGLFDATTAVVFGFIFFGLTFLGMIGVLPHYVTHYKINLNH